uniref:Uncharacterized protein n=1 Tax=Meloidogyne enterolobii TaxID=390850 RepID=A0A6V7U9H6_MELEN|nr:unnamed protein product [Meloidogyne enterolobii]
MNNKRDSSLFEEPPRSNKKVRLEACDDILSQVLNNNSIQIEVLPIDPFTNTLLNRLR